MGGDRRVMLGVQGGKWHKRSSGSRVSLRFAQRRWQADCEEEPAMKWRSLGMWGMKALFTELQGLGVKNLQEKRPEEVSGKTGRSRISKNKMCTPHATFLPFLGHTFQVSLSERYISPTPAPLALTRPTPHSAHTALHSQSYWVIAFTFSRF